MYGCNTGPNEVFAFNRTTCSKKNIGGEGDAVPGRSEFDPPPPTSSPFSMIRTLRVVGIRPASATTFRWRTRSQPQ